MLMIGEPPSFGNTVPKVTLICDSFVSDATFNAAAGLYGLFANFKLFVPLTTEPAAVTASIVNM